jgi:hypothetical protein
MVAGTYTRPDTGSANSVAAGVTAAALPFLTGGGEAKLAEETLLFRRGAIDGKKALAAQAEAAEAGLKEGIHGVSVSTSSAAREGQVVRCASCGSVEAAGFKVHKTGGDPNHYTAEMPKPVTSEIARIWNDLFK